MNAHHCHAHRCETPTAPKFFMCAKHWSYVPQEMRLAIIRNYRPGQERDKRPSIEYMLAVFQAKLHVAELENHAPREIAYLRETQKLVADTLIKREVRRLKKEFASRPTSAAEGKEG